MSRENSIESIKGLTRVTVCVFADLHSTPAGFEYDQLPQTVDQCPKLQDVRPPVQVMTDGRIHVPDLFLVEQSSADCGSVRCQDEVDAVGIWML